MDWRTWAFLPFSWGPGDGLRLADEGGRRLIMNADVGWEWRIYERESRRG